MKQILCVLAFCMTIVVACIKEQTTPKPLSSQIESRVTFMDDFYLSKIVKPLFHRIDTATMVTLFSDSFTITSAVLLSASVFNSAIQTSFTKILNLLLQVQPAANVKNDTALPQLHFKMV